MFRSTANMQPGGFYVGNTTGWMTGAAQPEFLRRVVSRCDLVTPRWRNTEFSPPCTAQVPSQHHAAGVLLPVGQVSAACAQAAATKSLTARALCTDQDQYWEAADLLHQ